MFLRAEYYEEEGNDPLMSSLLTHPSSPEWPNSSDFGFGYKYESNFAGVSSPASFSPLWNFSDIHYHHNPIPDTTNHNKHYFSVLCNPIAIRDLSCVFTDNPQSPTVDISIAVEVVSKYILHELDIIWNKKSHKRQSSNIVSNLSNILSRRVITSSTKECTTRSVLQIDNGYNLCIQNDLPLSIEPTKVIRSAEIPVDASAFVEPVTDVEQVPELIQADPLSLNQPPKVLVNETCKHGVIAKLDSQIRQTVVELDEIEGDIGYEVQGIPTFIRDKGSISSSRYTTSESAISLEDLREHFSMTREEAAKRFDISVSTLKRVCRKHAISRWPFRKRRNKYESPSKPKIMYATEQETVTSRSSQTDLRAVNTVQKVQFVTVKAKYVDKMIKFDLPYLSGMVELEEQIAKRLKLEVGSFSVEYEDEDGDEILLTNSEDLRYCIDTWTCLSKTTIRMLVKLTTS